MSTASPKGTSDIAYPLLDQILRMRLALHLFLATVLVVGARHRLTRDTDWQFFTWGSDLLFGQHHLFRRLSYTMDPALAGGLHLYANYSFLQIGPPAFLVAKALQWGPHQGLLLSGAVIAALGIAYLALLEHTFPQTGHGARLGALAGGASVTLLWAMVMYYRHLDDAMTLLALAMAAFALRRQRPLLCGVALGLAASCKPWGIPLLGLLLALPSGRTQARAAAAAVSVCVASWGPFVIADRGTFDIGRVALHVAADSPLAVLGARAVRDGGGIRLIQFGVGLVAVALIAARGQWAAAPLAAFGARLSLEPAAYPYYAAAIAAAAYLADLGARGGAVPILTLTATVGWAAAEVTSGSVAGWIRLVTYLTLVAAAVFLGLPRRRRPRTSPQAAAVAPTT